MLRLSESELLSELHDLAHTPGVDRIQVTWESADDSVEGVGGCCLLAASMPHLLACPADVQRIYISATGEIESDTMVTPELLTRSLNQARHDAGFRDLEDVNIRTSEPQNGRLHYDLEKIIQ